LAAFLPAAFFLVDFLAVFAAAFFFFAMISGSFRCSARFTQVGLSPKGAASGGETYQKIVWFDECRAANCVCSRAGSVLHARIEPSFGEARQYESENSRWRDA
jgi:hypothetical protein